MTVLVAVALTLTGPAHATLAPTLPLDAEAGTAMGRVAAFVNDADRQYVEATMADFAVTFGEWLKQITPPPPPPPSPSRSVPTGSPAAVGAGGGGGAHSDAWWQGVAVCEQGGRNDGYFGYFSVMDGSAGGGQSWDTQVQIVNGIISRYGDSAWAPACVSAGYRASPGG